MQFEQGNRHKIIGIHRKKTDRPVKWPAECHPQVTEMGVINTVTAAGQTKDADRVLGVSFCERVNDCKLTPDQKGSGSWEWIQLYHAWAYLQRTLHPTTDILAHLCSLLSIHNNQKLKTALIEVQMY